MKGAIAVFWVLLSVDYTFFLVEAYRLGGNPYDFGYLADGIALHNNLYPRSRASFCFLCSARRTTQTIITTVTT